MAVKILRVSSALTSSGAGQTVALDQASSTALSVHVDVTAATALTSLDLRMQWSFDAATWFEGAQGNYFATMTAVSTQTVVIDILAPYCRLFADLTGTSATFSATGYQTNYSPLNALSLHDHQTLVVTGYDFAISQGEIDGHQLIFKFGHNFDVDTLTVPEEIWPAGGAYTGFTAVAAQTLDLVSTVAADTVAGTGAQTVTVTGLDGSHLVVTDTVDMAGTTPVATTQTFLRVNDLRAATSGTGGTNAGDITASQTTSGIVMGVIEAGSSVEHNAQYTVPASSSLYIRRLYLNITAAGASKEATVAIDTRAGGSNLWVRHTEFVMITSDHLDQELEGSFNLPEKTDLRWRVIAADSNDTRLDMWWSAILEDNDA